MSECKYCSCEMKYINNILYKDFPNTKNILCKKNYSNLKFIIPFEFVFYFGSFSLFAYYNYKKNNLKLFI